MTVRTERWALQGSEQDGRRLPGWATSTISRKMSDEDPGRETRSKAVVGLMGLCALLVWFAALWFMFGDVL
jgi:hypothetical protein